MKGEKIQIKDAEVIEGLLKEERDLKVWKRLAFLNTIANHGISFEDASKIFLLSHSTAYEWIRKWNREGYEGLASKEDLRTGRPSKLNDEDLRELKELLKRKGYWQTSEVVKLIGERFGVSLSQDQVRRILRDKLKMKFSKPYSKDYRRPDNAEEILAKQIELTYRYLTEVKNYSYKEIAIGFADETSPQLTANTVRVWSFGKPEIKKNTQKIKANTMGFYALRGRSVQEFTIDSKTERFLEFLEKIRKENSEYKAVIVVLDNFPTHRSKRVKERAEEIGIYLVYLPPYSPDLNPIEFIWKSIKRIISLSFVRHLEELKQIINDAFAVLSQRLSFARAWVKKFLIKITPYYEKLCV